MSTEISVLTPAAAFAAGLATSLHCAAMCGPLACAFRVKPLEYHAGRVLSYTVVGAVSAAGGASLIEFLDVRSMRVLPWIMVAVLLVLASGLEKRIPQPRFLSRLLFRARIHRTLGLFTPMIPCGPLWLMLGAATVSGGWQSGAVLLAGFSLGTVPLPLLMQKQASLFQARFSPTTFRWFQQGIALVSASILAWRAALGSHACCL